MIERIEKLRALLHENHLAAALMTSATNIRYFSGFTSADAVAVVTEKRCVLFTDFRYLIQAKEQTAGRFEIAEINWTNYVSAIADMLRGEGCERCAFEQENMTVARFALFEKCPVQLMPLGDEISMLRVIKTPREVDCLQHAQNLADAAFSEFITRIGAGMTEKQAAAELNYVCARLGSEEPAFDPIVGSGPNGAMCHAVPSDRRLQKGDLVVVDFGCTYEGYRSDMTRTFGVGSLNDESRRIYEIVLEAQLRALAALKGGVGGKQLDAVARDYIVSKGYGECFGHSLGHGFGLEIHESPRASASSVDTLLPGMTITVEPGIYVEGLGGVRIEDCCVVTDDGKLNLVSTAKDLLIV